MEQNQHIHCLVENCHYWGQGNVCHANEIMVTTDQFGASQPDEVDAKQAPSLSTTPADSCMDTCCKTFVPRDGDIKLDGVKKIR